MLADHILDAIGWGYTTEYDRYGPCLCVRSRGMDIVSCMALRFGNLGIFSAWTTEEILWG